MDKIKTKCPNFGPKMFEFRPKFRPKFGLNLGQNLGRNFGPKCPNFSPKFGRNFGSKLGQNATIKLILNYMKYLGNQLDVRLNLKKSRSPDFGETEAHVAAEASQ